MKRIFTFFLCLSGSYAFSQANYTSAGSGLWNLPSSWTLSSGTDSDGDGIPDADDNVTIAASHTITVAVTSSCLAFTMANANSAVAINALMTLNVNGTFNVTRGAFTGTSGTLNITGGTVTFGNTTGGPTIAPMVNVSSLTITSQRTTYGSSVTMTKLAAGTTVDSWRGGNTFNGSFTFTNASANATDPIGDVYFGANAVDPADVFNGRATFYLTGCARIRIPQNGSATFNGVTSFYSQGYGANHDRIQPARMGSSTVTFNDSAYFICTSSTTDMHVAYDPGTSATFNGPVVASHGGTSAAAFFFGQDGTVAFNNHVTFNNTGSGTITITGGAGNSTLASGKQLLIGSSGFSSGTLNIQGFTQLGTTAQTLLLTGTSALRVGAVTGGCTFNANVNFTAPTLTLDSSIYNGTATFVKTGTTGDNCGGNRFNSTFSITDNGTGNINFSQVAADVFASTVTVTCTSSGIVGMSRTYNTIYPQNITLNNTGSGGIYFGNNAGTTTLASGKVFTVGGAGFTSGTLLFKNVTAPAAQTLNLGSAATFSVGTSAATGNSFGSTVNFGAGTLSAISNTIVGATTFTASTSITATSNTITSQATFTGSAITAASNNISSNATMTGSTSLTCTGNTIGGQATLSGGALSLLSNTIAGNATLSKTGSGSDDCGNNNFGGTFTITNTGSGGIRFSQITGADVFANTVTINSNSNGGITMSRTFNTIYPENIQVSNTGTNGVYFGFNGGSSTLNAGKTITTSTFSSGTLEFRKFTQVGNTTQALNVSGTAAVRFGNGNNTSCYFNGDLTVNGSNTNSYTADSSFFYRNMTVSAGTVVTFDSEYNGTAGTTSLTKTGSSTDDCGNNIFRAATSILNSGSGSLRFGQIIAGDVFQNDLTLTCGSTGGVSMSRTFASTYNGNIAANSYGSGGITFAANGGASTMAATKSINTGVSGFSSGTLTIDKFTQNGSATNTLTMTGSANLSIGTATKPSDFGGDIVITNNSNTTCNSSAFRRNFTMSTNGMQIEACVFNSISGSTTFTKSQTNSADNNGGNTFNGPFTLNQNGGVRVWMGQTTGADLFANTVTLNASSSSLIEMARTLGSAFQNTITLNSTSNGGITFGNNGGASTQSANMTISTGTFNNGSLDIRKFTQASGTQTNILTLTGGSTSLQIGNSIATGCDFGGSMNISCGFTSIFNGNQFRKDFTCTTVSIQVLSNTFNSISGSTTITKTGSGNDDTNGGNTWNGVTTLTINAGGGRWRLGTTADDYNGNLTLVQSQISGLLQPSYNANSTYAGDLTVTTPNNSTVMTFGSGASGVTTFDGSNAQNFSLTSGSAIPLLTRMVMNKSAADLTLNTRINIGTILTMTQGNINTTQTNILNMNDAATTTVGNALSYINGPMNYDMAVNNTTRTLNMPLGKGTDWRPVALTVRHSAATSYTYNSEMFNLPASYLNWTLPVTVDTVSSMRYWDITRYITGTTTQASGTNLSYSAGVYPLIQLYFGTNDGVYQGANLTIVKNTVGAPTTWIDIGGSSGIGNNATPVAGSVISTSSPTAFNSFSRFTLGSKTTGTNPLPVEFVSFEVTKQTAEAILKWTTGREENSNYFSIQHSADGINFEELSKMEAAHYSAAYKEYSYVHTKPVKGLSYYRVKEYDYNGDAMVTCIRSVLFDREVTIAFYPNPVKELLYFETNEKNNYLVSLFGMQGEELGHYTFAGASQLDLGAMGLAAGIYTLKIESNGTVIHSPLIITK